MIRKNLIGFVDQSLRKFAMDRARGSAHHRMVEKIPRQGDESWD
jgi:hypothetical protein